MSKCISSHGEYDSHETDPDTYVCTWCHEFDEAGALAEIARLRRGPVTGMEHAIEQVANALHGDQCAEDPDPGERCTCGADDFYRQAEIAIDTLREAGLLAPAPLREGGVGWYEVIHPSRATTHIAYVHEDGSIYFPEGDYPLSEHEFAFAAATGRAHRLVRADAVNRAEGDKEVDL